MDETIYIGKKPTTTYVFSVTTQAKEKQEIKVMARGRCISKAVDVVQISLNRFLKDWEISKINLGTQEKEGKEKTDRVSYIEIIIKKK